VTGDPLGLAPLHAARFVTARQTPTVKKRSLLGAVSGCALFRPSSSSSFSSLIVFCLAGEFEEEDENKDEDEGAVETTWLAVQIRLLN